MGDGYNVQDMVMVVSVISTTTEMKAIYYRRSDGRDEYYMW